MSIRIYPRILQTVSSKPESVSELRTVLSAFKKQKELTYSRISRGLLHILLAVKKEDMLRYRESSCIYTRILGFRKEHADVLRQIKENASIPVITKLGQTDSLLPETIRMLDQTTFASDLYESVVSDKFGIPS